MTIEVSTKVTVDNHRPGASVTRCYTARMRSVADALRRESRDRVLALDAEARLALALRLGTEDAHLLSAVRGVSLRDAERAIARTRSHGRVPSAANRIESR